MTPEIAFASTLGWQGVEVLLPRRISTGLTPDKIFVLNVDCLTGAWTFKEPRNPMLPRLLNDDENVSPTHDAPMPSLTIPIAIPVAMPIVGIPVAVSPHNSCAASSVDVPIRLPTGPVGCGICAAT